MHNGPIYSLDYSPNSMMLASGSMDKSAKILKFKNYGIENERDPNEMAELDIELNLGTHKGMIRSVKFG